MLRIVLIDDEPIVLEGIRHILNKYADRFEVAGVACDGNEGLRLINRVQPDIVITDIRMPGLDGIELLKNVKEVYPDIYFTILTGFAEFEYAKKAIHYGSFDFLLKPVEYTELINVLGKIENKLTEKQQMEFKNKNIEASLADYIKESGRIKILKSLLNDNVQDIPEIGGRIMRIAVIKAEDCRLITQRNAISDSIDEVIIHNFSPGMVLETLKFNSQWIAILDGGYSEEELKKSITAMDSNISRRLTVGVSGQCEHANRLKQAYNEAFEALELLVFNEKPGIMFFEDIQTQMGSQNPPNGISVLDQDAVVERIMAGQTESLKQYLRNISEEAEPKGLLHNPQLFKRECSELLIYICRLLKDKGVNIEKNHDGKLDFTHDLELLENHRQVFDFLKAQLIDMARAVENSKSSLPRSICIALNYIESHYYEEITLKLISEMVFLNPWYFSELFKEKVGTPFTDYLLNYRIEKAKALLKQLDLKTYQVSEMVGFNDSAYFCNIFKKITGTTPGVFRKTAVIK